MEAQSGLKGICPGCSQPVIAKCGEKKIHHWAHKRSASCDSWWENETQWHRDWKDNFPKEYQEVFLPDKRSGENHIADVKTEHGVVLEFQHSAIKPQEQRSRESFYKNMVWIVDGTRLKLDYRRFCKWRNNDIDCQSETKINHIYFMSYPEWWLNKSWIDSKVMVVFDFGKQECVDTPEGNKQLVWCLLPGRIGHKAVIVEGTKDGLIKRLNESSQPLPWSIEELMQDFGIDFRKQEERNQQEQRRAAAYYALRRTRRKIWV